jgi:hypothetical protein
MKIDGSMKNADSVRPNTLIMALRCFDPGIKSKRSSNTSLTNSGKWAGFTTGYAEFLKSKIAMVETDLLNFQKTGSDRTRRVLPKKS